MLTDHSKAVLLLWIIYVFLSCVCNAFVHVCLFVPCGHLIVSITDLCTHTYFSSKNTIIKLKFSIFKGGGRSNIIQGVSNFFQGGRGGVRMW